MKKIPKNLFLIIIPLLLCTILYFFLPAQIPRQFHADGTITYMSKEFIFLFAFLPYLIYTFSKNSNNKLVTAIKNYRKSK